MSDTCQPKVDLLHLGQWFCPSFQANIVSIRVDTNLGLTAEYPAISKLCSYNSGYMAMGLCRIPGHFKAVTLRVATLPRAPWVWVWVTVTVRISVRVSVRVGGT